MASVTRSFRLNPKLIRRLAVIARKYGLTENQLVATWLSSRVSFDPLVPTFEIIVLGRDTFRSILGIADIDALEVVAWELGQRHFSQAKAIFESMDRQLTLFTYLTEILGEHAHWIRIEGHVDESREKIILHHDLTIRWSVFLKSYISGAYSVISRENLAVDTNDHFVRVKFPPSLLSS